MPYNVDKVFESKYNLTLDQASSSLTGETIVVSFR